MSTSIEEQELFIRDSRYQSGPLLKSKPMPGKLMLTQERLGIKPLEISTLRLHQCHSSVKDKSQIPYNGFVLSSSERECLPDFSIMKFLTLPG
jgi:hypothetical protein